MCVWRERERERERERGGGGQAGGGGREEEETMVEIRGYREWKDKEEAKLGVAEK